ncbi:MAG: endonuclease/exonuclease/phosphatase family protein [Bacteroidales bacterium]|nr:endonuclease/exonuclease/phosphatase family protein [Bacteroidales bacterium]
MKTLLRIVLIIANAVVALLFLLSTMAGRFAPSEFELPSLLSYGYLILLAANLVMAAVWLCAKSWWFLLSAIPMLLRISLVPAYIQIGGVEEEALEDSDHTCLTILDYNIHEFWGPEDKRELADSNAALFVGMLREENPDVLTLQEFYTPGKFHLIDSMKALGYRYAYGPNMNGKVPYGVAIFSKYPFDKTVDLDSNRKCHVVITKERQKFRIMCVHMDSYMLTPENLDDLKNKDSLDIKQRTKPVINKLRTTYKRHELEWQEELLPLIEESDLPLLICGDFNDTPASYLYQNASKHLKDCFVELGHGIGTTYHGMYPDFRIDYILHSKNLEAASYKRIKNDISDHYAIKSKLYYRP